MARGWWASLPEGSYLALFAEHGDRIVRDEEFAECHSAHRGRPSTPSSLGAKVLHWPRVRCCYASGPTGDGLARHLRARGIECDVVAPGLVPARAGRPDQDRPA